MTAGRTNTITEKNWFTPIWLVDSVEAFFGGTIDLDPCWSEGSPVRASVKISLPDDGLLCPWDSARIYVNPPYGRDDIRGTTIKDWFRKCAQASAEGSEVICLCPVATNTSHWKEFIYPHASRLCFLKDSRFRFVGGSSKGAPMAVCLVYWGFRGDEFTQHFSQYGQVVRFCSTA